VRSRHSSLKQQTYNRHSDITIEQRQTVVGEFSDQVDPETPKVDSTASVMTVNCRSVCNKIDQFRSLLEVYKPEVIVAVETWLDSGYTDSEITVDNYVFYRRDRNKHGGGIMVGLKPGVSGTVLWTDEEEEMMGMKITVGKKSFKLIAGYRPPSIGKSFVNRLRERLEEMNIEDTVIVTGDMNLPNIRWEAGGNASVGEGNGTQKEVTEIMNGGFVQAVQEGTRKTPSGGNNILDVTLIRPEEIWMETTIVDGISDHRIPLVRLMLETEKEDLQNKQVWYYKRARAKAIREAFKKRYWHWREECSDVENTWENFKKICEDVRTMCVPSKLLTRNPDPPHYDKKVKNLKRKCRKIHNMEKRNILLGARLEKTRKELEKAKVEAKERFVHRIFDEKDLQGSWNRMYRYVGQNKKSVRSIPTLKDKRGCEWVDDKGKAGALNGQYAEVFSVSGKNRYSMEGAMRKGEEVRFSRMEIWNVIRKLKNGKAPGHDGITNDLIKLAGKEILPYLMDLFNISIKEARVPKEWKEAIIVPIFKGGARGLVQNYRPVSLTSAVCKIMERLLDLRIKHILEKNEPLSAFQHGFRKDFSCETQALGLETDLVEVLDRGGRVDAIFLDLEKAFDKVDHEILMKKLWERVENIEIVNWIGNFLCNRVQRAKVGRTLSEEVRVTSGVPQGSVVGPLLFDIYIDDLAKSVKSKVRLFADDSVLYREIKNEEDKKILQEDIDAVGKWVAINKMGLNVGKCKVVCFNKGRKACDGEYKADGSALETVNSYKYLGVVFARNLEWKEHIERVSKKGITALNFVMRQLRGMDQKIKEKAYMTLIRPIVEYGSSVWDPYRIGEVKYMEKVQRLAARRVTGKMRRLKKVIDNKGNVKQVLERPSIMVQELGWQTLEFRRKKDRLCNYYRALLGKGGWKELQNHIEMNEARYVCRREHRRRVVVKRSRGDVGKYSFLRRTGKEWNEIDARVFVDDYATGDNVNKFRKLLDQFNM
jgi:Reverse transcriptase (RNA-dependent DNA polymerase)/Endonuclease-reverse transcriptase